jgi:hypothetical protein
MPEESMSVWPKPLAPLAPLAGSEGELIAVSIAVDPRRLETLLEAIAGLSFPINPQIYHEAALIYRYADGRETSEDVTLVEFPAYEKRLEEVRGALAAYGFDPESARVASMLDEIHAGGLEEPAPPGAPYVARRRIRGRSALVH